MHRSPLFHFPVPLFTGIALLVLGSASLCYHLFTTDNADILEYNRLWERANPRAGLKNASPYTARQKRRGIAKDIYYNKEGKRLQMKLNSADSHIALEYSNDKTEVVENMRDVQCVMQEELFYQLPDGRHAFKQQDGQFLIKNSESKEEPSWYTGDPSDLKPLQTVRYIESDTAAYHYKNETLTAENVQVFCYVLEGHRVELPSKDKIPAMRGSADSVEIALAESDFSFKAHNLKAFFTSETREDP